MKQKCYGKGWVYELQDKDGLVGWWPLYEPMSEEKKASEYARFGTTFKLVANEIVYYKFARHSERDRGILREHYYYNGGK